MRLPRPFLILSHFPYFCNTRVHFLALTAQACYLFLSCPCICTQNIFFIPRNFFQPSRAFPLYGWHIGTDLSAFNIQTCEKKKKKFDDGDGDGTKSRVDRARFVLPAPSLIHSGPSIERIKCRVSDAMRKKNCAARPWFTFITLFAPRLVLRLVAPINQQRTLFACIPAPEINKSRYSIIGKNIRGGF